MDHFYQNIHGWMDYEPLYTQMVDVAPNPAHFVEIGSWKGRSAAFMCVEIANSGKSIRFDCVDTWQGSDVHQAGGAFEDPDCTSGNLLHKFYDNMRPAKGMFNALVMTSTDAAILYANKSLDFVFIDADHEYPSVIQDISAWLPKIKTGGYLAGHDYFYGPVRLAVDELLPQAVPYPHGCWITKVL